MGEPWSEETGRAIWSTCRRGPPLESPGLVIVVTGEKPGNETADNLGKGMVRS